MVITRLQGGLGNQMFQYAAGRALAARLATGLKIDASFLGNDPGGSYTKRSLELGQLNVTLDILSGEELQKISSRSFITRIFGKTTFKQLRDDAVGIANFSNVTGNVYLDGYWQSERYFLPIRNVLLREFTPAYSAGSSEALKKKLETPGSVAVHVRRGDYVTLASASAYHGVLDMNYYETAFREIKKRVPDARFFVFSDDPSWCLQAFSGLGIEEVIDGHGQPASRDLLLMSSCSHNIIANSSYSWWGAWLNDNPGKVVVAPARWYRAEDARGNEIICKSWLRV